VREGAQQSARAHGQPPPPCKAYALSPTHPPPPFTHAPPPTGRR
jgi:hypothetical protein